jgi:HK97 family phage major capsid protein
MRKLAFVAVAVAVACVYVVAASTVDLLALAGILTDPHLCAAVPATIPALREKQQKLVADARVKLEEIEDDTPEPRAKEIEAEYDAIMAEYDTLEGQVQQLEARDRRRQQLEEREQQLSRPDPRRPTGNDIIVPPPQQQPDAEIAEQIAARRAAFNAYLRYGSSGLTAEQRALLVRAPVENRAQSSQAVTTGAYLVPTGFMAELIIALKAWGPMLDPGVARELVTATGADIPWPSMDDTSNEGSIIAENTQLSSTEVTFGPKVLGAYKYTSGVVLVPSELLQDSALDIEAIIRVAMAERIGRVGNRHLTVGTGNSMPNGIVTAAGAGATAAAPAALVMDDLINLEHSVDPAYRADPSCRWQFNDSTLKMLRKLKDGEGRYIWQPADARAGAPSTISNYPYSINQHMADVASGAASVIFGAMNRYIVRKVNEFSIRRLVERYADFDQTGFIGFMRMDGELLDTTAVRKLTHP